MFGLELQVYSVGWYADEAGAGADPSLRGLLGLGLPALQASAAYYSALIAPNCSYDRSLLVKFLMNVKTKTMLSGIIEDSYLSPSNMVGGKQNHYDPLH